MVCLLFPVLAIVLLLIAAVVILLLTNAKSGRLLMLGLIVALLLIIAVGGAILFVRSRSLTLTIDTPPGHSYVGKVVADGREIAIRGDTDQELNFPGTVFSYAVILEHPDGVHELTVSDGFTSSKSTLGVDGDVTRHFPTSTTSSISGMVQSEWDWAADELIPDRNEGKSESGEGTADAVSGSGADDGAKPLRMDAEPDSESAPPGST